MAACGAQAAWADSELDGSGLSLNAPTGGAQITKLNQ